MQIRTVINEAGQATLDLAGNFTFQSHREFKEATVAAIDDAKTEEVILDFGNVEYIDSAGLGMLLLLNERIGSKKLSLINCKGTVKDVLQIANFNKIFTIN